MRQEVSSVSLHDVEFEYALFTLQAALTLAKRKPDDKPSQKTLCRALRAAKLAYGDMYRKYGDDYDIAAYRRLLKKGSAVAADLGPTTHLASIRRHVREMLASLSARGTVGPERRRKAG